MRDIGDNIKKQYYSLKEVSELLDIDEVQMHYWATLIPDVKPAIKGRKMRKYLPEQLQVLYNIKTRILNGEKVTEIAKSYPGKK